jgi:hypothetical protein
MLGVGGLDAFKKDYEISLKHGVDLCIANDGGPAGVMRAARTIPVMLEIVRDMERLCHGVQTTLGLIAGYLGLQKSEIDFAAAGYHTRQVGKSHVGRHKFIDVFSENNSPWDRWSPPWYDDDDYYAFLRDKNLERFGLERGLYGKDPSGRARGNFYGGWLAPQKGRPFPPEASYPAFLVEKAIRCLEAWDPNSGSL